MSEWLVQVVRLGKIVKHPNTDMLGITQVQGRYPVICKASEFSPGDLAVHVPVDSLVPVTRPEFSWLKETYNGYHRVRFIRLRGVPSYGFLIPVSGSVLEGQVREGDLVPELLGIKKYKPREAYQMEGQGLIEGFSGQYMIPYYDIQGLRKYEQLFSEGEDVYITEKIHGSNGRWVFIDGSLRSGSRTKFRRDSVWNRMAEQYRLQEILSEHPNIVLYGEVYGSGIQDLTYDLKDEQRVAFFDMLDLTTGRWVDSGRFFMFCEGHGLPTVPILYQGPFRLQKAYELAEGQSTIASHAREGVVIKPYQERWDQEVGRVFLKLHGEGYLLRKEAKDA